MYELRQIYSPPVFASESLAVNALGAREWMRRGHMVIRPPAGDWLLMFFHGEALAGVSSEKLQPAAGKLMIWRPDTPQAYGSPYARWLHSWVHVGGGWVGRRLRQLELATDTLHDGAGQEIAFSKLLHELYAEARYAETRPEMASALLDIFLMRLARRQPDPVREELQRARHYLEQHLADRVILADVARAAGLSVSQLCAVFKETYGTSPMRSLHALRMTQAAFLLRTRKLRVGEAARAVGFPDVYHFSKAFKGYHGYSPSQCRTGDEQASASSPTAR